MKSRWLWQVIPLYDNGIRDTEQVQRSYPNELKLGCKETWSYVSKNSVSSNQCQDVETAGTTRPSNLSSVIWKMSLIWMAARPLKRSFKWLMNTWIITIMIDINGDWNEWRQERMGICLEIKTIKKMAAPRRNNHLTSLSQLIKVFIHFVFDIGYTLYHNSFVFVKSQNCNKE